LPSASIPSIASSSPFTLDVPHEFVNLRAIAQGAPPAIAAAHIPAGGPDASAAAYATQAGRAGRRAGSGGQGLRAHAAQGRQPHQRPGHRRPRWIPPRWCCPPTSPTSTRSATCSIRPEA
jgi:hypothetical protein